VAEHEIVHVAIDPPGEPDADLARQVAAIIDKAPYDTRLDLAGKLPKIVAHHDNVQTAQSTVQSLRDLGLVAVLCKDSELRKPGKALRPQTLEFGSEGILFRSHDSQERSVGSGDVFLIMAGTRETHTREEATTTTKKFSLPATVLTGGIPIWRNVKETTAEASHKAERFARVYDRESSEPRVEILQHNVDYSFLEAQMAPSSLVNFNSVVDRLRRLSPHAIFDDRLTTHSVTDKASSRLEDDIEVSCRLIYLCHLARTEAAGDK
jgi:hypothetical protein